MQKFDESFKRERERALILASDLEGSFIIFMLVVRADNKGKLNRSSMGATLEEK